MGGGHFCDFLFGFSTLTQRAHHVDATCQRRCNVTLIQRCINVICPLKKSKRKEREQILSSRLDPSWQGKLVKTLLTEEHPSQVYLIPRMNQGKRHKMRYLSKVDAHSAETHIPLRTALEYFSCISNGNFGVMAKQKIATPSPLCKMTSVLNTTTSNAAFYNIILTSFSVITTERADCYMLKRDCHCYKHSVKIQWIFSDKNKLK